MKSIYTKTGILSGISFSLRNYVLRAQFTGRNRLTPKTMHVCIIKRNDRSRRAENQPPELRKSEPGKQRSETMESKEPRQINEFKVVDEHGNGYTLVEYQNVTETRSLKRRRAGPSWFG